MARVVSNKYPGERKRYGADWSASPPDGPWLEDGAGIATSTWEVAPATTPPIVLEDGPGGTHDATTTAVIVSGGLAGARYWLTNTVTDTTDPPQTGIEVLTFLVEPTGAPDA